ncbi:hypothetical protein O181_047863 [Austropuccinia psidii MF-1]|uniref:Uncharacterized protein n=1 Tax=Austropuccinia psidii MF-1 TaxID=1389203 RepID=A0A9Q3HJY2_9BASI|nr:hypothetical protein [Austropuccinia psidii MF-1]
MENSSEEAIFNIETESPMSWSLKQKDRLISLHPDMSKKMVHIRIFRKGGGDLEHAIRSRFIDYFSTEYYINEMEDIIPEQKLVETFVNPQYIARLVGNQFQDQINHNKELL